jgi:hypothetical protein
MTICPSKAIGDDENARMPTQAQADKKNKAATHERVQSYHIYSIDL